MQQRLRRDAADIETHTTQRRMAFDEDHLEAEIGSTEGGGISAGSATEDKQVAGEVGRNSVTHNSVLRISPSN